MWLFLQRYVVQNWVIVDEEYLNYLRKIESRIPLSDYGVEKFKPFFGILFTVDDLVYVTPISHAQPRHYKMKNSLDFYKIYIEDKTPIYQRIQFQNVVLIFATLKFTLKIIFNK